MSKHATPQGIYWEDQMVVSQRWINNLPIWDDPNVDQDLENDGIEVGIKVALSLLGIAVIGVENDHTKECEKILDMQAPFVCYRRKV